MATLQQRMQRISSALKRQEFNQPNNPFVPGRIGTVTNVEMAVPSIFSLSGSPITASGTFQAVSTLKYRPLSVNVSTVGNVGAGEDDLMSYSVPGETLGSDRNRITFRASGSIASSINAKRIKVYFGSTVIFDTGVAGIPISTSIDWVITGEVIRTGATAQLCNAMLNTDNASLASYANVATAAETLSGSVIIKLTGEAVSDNDIVQNSLCVDFYAGV